MKQLFTKLKNPQSKNSESSQVHEAKNLQQKNKNIQLISNSTVTKLLNPNLIISLLIWLVLLILWVFFSNLQLINTAFFPTPEIFFKSVSSQNFWAAFGADFLASISRFFLGITFGVILNYILILVGFYLQGFYTFLTQLNKIFKYLPSPVVIPLNILFFGINDFTIIATAAFSSFILYLNFSIGIIEKEENNFQQIQKNWKISSFQRFRLFYLPISSYLNYRIIPAMLVWTFGIVLITEIILGGKFGLGIRLLQYQQLYQTGNLFLLVLLILIVAFVLERLFINFFARLKNDFKKTCSLVLLVLLLITSVGYQGYNAVVKIQTESSPQKKIVTYKAAINLPFFVLVEKFNQQNYTLETVASGTQAVDTLLAKQAAISGFGDIPNVVAAFGKDKNLEVFAQIVEKPEQPSLFLVSNTSIQSNDYSSLNNSRVGFYPNNPVIQKGLEFVFGLNKANSSSIEFIGSNDPNSLSQGLAAGQLQAFLSLEPYVADTENRFNLERINPKNTAIKGITFTNLPLAAGMLDKNQLSQEEQKILLENIQKSIEFIRKNSTSDYKATGELISIMEKYNINKDSSLSAFQLRSEINPEDLKVLINLLQIFGVTKDINNFDYPSFYGLD